MCHIYLFYSSFDRQDIAASDGRKHLIRRQDRPGTQRRYMSDREVFYI
jgi:hypothetical protein